MQLSHVWLVAKLRLFEILLRQQQTYLLHLGTVAIHNKNLINIKYLEFKIKSTGLLDKCPRCQKIYKIRKKYPRDNKNVQIKLFHVYPVEKF